MFSCTLKNEPSALQESAKSAGSENTSTQKNSTTSTNNLESSTVNLSACQQDLLVTFQSNIWQPILSQKCIGCHQEGGLAAQAGSRMVFKDGESVDQLQNNWEQVQKMWQITQKNIPLVLLKPSAQVTHGGGQVLALNSTEYKNLSDQLTQLNNKKCSENAAEATSSATVTATSTASASNIVVQTATSANSSATSTAVNKCLTASQYFSQKLWPAVLSPKCVSCHNPQGVAVKQGAQFILQSGQTKSSLDQSTLVVNDFALSMRNGESLLLQKPTGKIEHGGGTVLSAGSAELALLKEYVGKLQSGWPTCDAGLDANSNPSNVAARFELQTPQQTLRTATLVLLGRLPNEQEITLVSKKGEAGLVSLIDTWITEEGFANWVRETFNDIFWTDKYLINNGAINLISNQDFASIRWFDMFQANDASKASNLARKTNLGLARESIELVLYIIKEGRPISEILTADYTLVNPYSARSYGLTQLAQAFKDADDPAQVDANKFFPAKIPNYVHSGVISTPAWLNRFPSTLTNRNRHRARYYMLNFLDTDILKFGNRSIDPTQITDHNPTMFNPQCTLCHAMLDPIAGAFQNWDERGRATKKSWYQDMRPPGFSEKEPLPIDQIAQSLVWLNQRVVQDSRFLRSIVQLLLKALSGKSILLSPQLSDPDYALKIQQYEAQQDFISQVVQKLQDNKQNLKWAFQEIILSSYFRAREIKDTTLKNSSVLAATTPLRLLSPESLDRKITAILGLPWLINNRHALTDATNFRLLYGGIDSDNVLKRANIVSGVMAAIQQRLAYEMSCAAVPRDLTTQDLASRKLLPYVTREMAPTLADGRPDPESQAGIRKTIVYLHQRLLGEDLPLDHAEVERSYQLFVSAWTEGKKQIAAKKISLQLPSACQVTKVLNSTENLSAAAQVTTDPQFIIRAWIAVVNYLLMDFRFVYE